MATIKIRNNALKRKLFVRIIGDEIIIDPEIQSLSGLTGPDGKGAYILNPRTSMNLNLPEASK